MPDRGDADYVAVRRRFCRGVDADVAAGTWTLFNHDTLAQRRRDPLGLEAHEHLGRAAGRPGHDDPHRPCRPSLCTGAGRRGESCSSSEQVPAFHGRSPRSFFFRSRRPQAAPPRQGPARPSQLTRPGPPSPPEPKRGTRHRRRLPAGRRSPEACTTRGCGSASSGPEASSARSWR